MLWYADVCRRMQGHEAALLRLREGIR
jgi:hypothetical protein